MEHANVATPFGRRPMSLAMMASQKTARAMPEGACVHKWQTFHAIREARELLGASDRGLSVLNALLTFHPDTELSSDGTLIVWPSNAQLASRANGMSPATLRRHLAVLVDCGLIIRRDSPNGKRFARKGRGGHVEQAYGFDLSPLVARASEFAALAEQVAAKKRAYKCQRERLTLLRRDVIKLIEAGLDEGVVGPWETFSEHYRRIVDQLPRSPSIETLDDVCDALEQLRHEVHIVLEKHAISENMSANESHSERHIQNSKPDYISESEKSSRKIDEASGAAEENDNLKSLPKRELPLGIVLDACKGWHHLAKDGEIRSWRDFLAAAEVGRVMLGVSPSAWHEACEVLGERYATIALAAIYQRADQINSPGGYLRNLTDKAREGKFSVWPMIMALLNAKLEAGKAAAQASSQTQRATESRKGGFEVSDALRQSMKRWSS
ncbi:replication initiation protein RepC [Martelella lutilitoris]|uniref:Replication initiation protein RepC n=1 Tax=Martelella lutilitoris TaxID=2583532 RepID=A0A5C4JLR8_9HYPH|nr:plasmid replication protein RepC [Martelella lutilitoris]TNB46247.1 replication initiation protein RepC [Martelella lutilitoris]